MWHKNSNITLTCWKKNGLLLEKLLYFENSWTAVTLLKTVVRFVVSPRSLCCVFCAVVFADPSCFIDILFSIMPQNTVWCSYLTTIMLETYWAQVWERFFCWGIQVISITVDAIADMLTWCIKTEFQLMCVSCFIMKLAYPVRFESCKCPLLLQLTTG